MFAILSSFSSVFTFKDRLVYLVFVLIVTMNFPLRMAFAASHRFLESYVFVFICMEITFDILLNLFLILYFFNSRLFRCLNLCFFFPSFLLVIDFQCHISVVEKDNRSFQLFWIYETCFVSCHVIYPGEPDKFSMCILKECGFCIV